MIEIFLIVSGFINLILGFAVWNILKKLEKYEQFYSALQNGLRAVTSEMKAIDIRGAFAADDEVGIVFTILHKLVDSLDNFLDGDGENE